MEGHTLMEEDKLLNLINTSDQSVYLFVKDGKVTMVLDKLLDTEFLVSLFSYVTAVVLSSDVDNSGGNMLH
jgi:hypothetical protein